MDTTQILRKLYRDLKAKKENIEILGAIIAVFENFSQKVTNLANRITKIESLDLKDGKTPVKGVDYFDGGPDTPAEIKIKLELLQGNERLDASAIKNLPETKMINYGGGGIAEETDPIWLKDKPYYYDIIQLQSYIASFDFSTFSGDYNDLANLPDLFDGDYNSLSSKPSLFSGVYSDLTGKPTLSTVAGTGAYSDLTGKPTLGTLSTLNGIDISSNTNLAASGGVVLTNDTLSLDVNTTVLTKYLQLIGGTMTGNINMMNTSNIVFGDSTHDAGKVTMWTNGETIDLAAGVVFSDANERGYIIDRVSIKKGRFDIDAFSGKAEFRVGVDGGSEFGIFNKAGYYDYARWTSARRLTTGHIVLDQVQTPSSSTAAGVKGQIEFDDNYGYRCIADNVWKRWPISTW